MIPRLAVEIESCDECGNEYVTTRLAAIWEAGEHKLMCPRCVDELRMRLLHASELLGGEA